MRGQTDAVKAFLREIAEVCRRHRLALGHEDTQGAFLVWPLKKLGTGWLEAAFDRTVEEETPPLPQPKRKKS